MTDVWQSMIFIYNIILTSKPKSKIRKENRKENKNKKGNKK